MNSKIEKLRIFRVKDDESFKISIIKWAVVYRKVSVEI
jgi:hypothetical protein